MIKEIWKVIPGHSRYEASTLGRFRKIGSDKILSQVITGEPQYWYVNTTRDSDNTNNVRRVHLLLAQTFIENPDNLPVVDHINQDKFDNRLENLRWVTRSGNGRNKYNSVYVEYEGDKILLVELVEKLFGEQEDMLIYQFLSGRIKTKGETLEQALSEYERYTNVGVKLRKIEYKGEQVFLKTLCDEKGYDYQQSSRRLNQGWSDWNVAYNINPNLSGKQFISGSVNLWFPDEISAQDYFCVGLGTLERLTDVGYDFANIASYDKFEGRRDMYRQEVLGVRGTIAELAEHFGKTLSCVQARLNKGMSLEEALTAPIGKLKYVTINGDRKTLKAWYAYFNLLDGKVRKWRDNNKGMTFTQTLENFGVDISNLKILEG